jgi:hypothetical protein
VSWTPSPTDRDPDAERALTTVLESGEVPLWTAHPSAPEFACLQPRLLVLGAFWTVVWVGGFYGFADTLLGMEYDGTPRTLRLLAVLVAATPFLLVSAYGLGGHLLVFRRQQRRTSYAVTDRRVIVQRPLLGAYGPLRTRMLPRGRVGEIVAEDEEGSGALLEVHDRERVETPLVLAGLGPGSERVRELLASAPASTPTTATPG